MSFHNRTYTIVDYPPAEEVWDVVLEAHATCRKSVDGSQVVLKWEGATPAPLIAAPQYSHAEALALMHTPAWTPEEPPP